MRSRAFPYLLILPVFSSALFTRSQCYDGIFTLVSRGSEEPQGQSVLETIAGGIAAALPGSGSNEVVYPALLSFWDSAPIGVTNAQQQLQDYYEQCPNGKIVLLGYSQGSYVLTTTLAGGNYSGQSWSPLASNIAENIAAIVLFGDQSRMLGQGTLATGTNCATTCTATAPLALKSPYSTSMQVYFDRLEEWCDADAPATTFKLIYLTGPQIPPIRVVNHVRFRIIDIVHRVVKPGRDNINDYIVRGCIHIADRSTDHVHEYYFV
ncbi:hypothetical protein LTS12_009180 [Elasticomyces elasticus]|nr:hypothetical protein LTS12_009180 [Elasticomyces elasticus]